ncbi:hypothetical protein [Devosia sp. MC521]|uniref:hypothetical protein n=1 Tax=Devosia sp. MC521 TaxID=2759954 RepID=UPI0015FB8B45|nr:hypothetical protein [Devosia sp. MC521]MBJ6987268.1 hypothetical protein [Devosia sp. MC521]QMW62876.1 hypothetical protein H4N61_00445 [Devosia sp. MC521]
MANMDRDDLVEELQALLVQVLADAEATIANLHRQREIEVKTVTLRLQTERYRDQMATQERLQLLGGRLIGLRETVQQLPALQRDGILAQLGELKDLVQMSLDGGAVRPLLLDELAKWTPLRKGHAADKKVKTDDNRIRDFVTFAGDRPVNKYKFSDLQAFTNLLARVPANMVKDPRLRAMSREQAAD